MNSTPIEKKQVNFAISMRLGTFFIKIKEKIKILRVKIKTL